MYDPQLYGKYVRSASATNSSNSTAVGNKRLTRVINGEVWTVDEIRSFGFGGTIKSAVAKIERLGLTKEDIQPKPSSSQVQSESANQQPTTPLGYKFNLPPHEFSMPTEPNIVDPGIISGANRSNPSESFHGLRRGRIWYWNTSGDITQINASGEAENLGSKYSGKGNVAGGSKVVVGEDRKYGFQFLWNPEAIQVNVVRNMDITPSAADSLRVVAGVFPGQETLSLNITIDRTNDFAALKHYTRYGQNWSSFSRFYTGGYPGQAPQPFEEEIKKLMNQGTLYDLEYLFRAINGDGIIDKDGNKAQYANLLKRVTANVGYLQPTLLGIELGPSREHNLSYVGWISNLSMNHLRFTETMIPLQTQVQISVECFTGSGIGAAKS